MKRWLCLALVGMLLLCCTACNGEPVSSVDAGMELSTITSLATTSTIQTTTGSIKTTTSKPTISKQLTTTTSFFSSSTTLSTTRVASTKEMSFTTTIPTKPREKFSSEPYVFIEERNAASQIDEIDWDTVLEKIPSDYYEQYPGQLSAPLTATLYKDGKVINLDIKDPRLIRLLNFYNNSIYHGIRSITQGSYNSGYEFINAYEYRLVLTYTPIHTGMEDSFDKQIVCGSVFVGIRTNIPFADDSFSSFGRWPLYAPDAVDWLPLFGL